jgi:putative iron-dependent peroxidase
MISSLCQEGILAPPAAHGRSLSYRVALEVDPASSLRRLAAGFDPAWGVVGLGEPLLRALGRTLPGLRVFPALSGPAFSVPSTQQALWVYLRGPDRGSIFDHSEAVDGLIAEGLVLESAVDTFTYAGGRDLTGYMDGTANPSGEDAVAAALVDSGAGMAGSSFVAVQRWVHDLARFRGHSQAERDMTIGRRLAGNEEIAEAPASAHVKRTAQEEFNPPAFMLRRSMPWAGACERGLEFVAFGRSLDAYERALRRMVGLDDGIVDALFRFSRPVSGGYYWCPPVAANRLDVGWLKL